MSAERFASDTLTEMEALAARIDPDAPWLRAYYETATEMMVEAGLDPADPLHRRAVALGLAAARSPRVMAELELVVIGALRPPASPLTEDPEEV